MIVTRYVLGFLFHDNARSVVLVRKNRPKWQAGRLNGVGGKIQEGESEITAMIREFHEEAGVATTVGHWEKYCEMIGPTWAVSCFRAFDLKAWYAARTVEAECVEKYHLSELAGQHCVANLNWLIELARDEQYGKELATVRYEY